MRKHEPVEPWWPLIRDETVMCTCEVKRDPFSRVVADDCPTHDKKDSNFWTGNLVGVKGFDAPGIYAGNNEITFASNVELQNVKIGTTIPTLIGSGGGGYSAPLSIDNTLLSSVMKSSWTTSVDVVIDVNGVKMKGTLDLSSGATPGEYEASFVGAEIKDP